MFVPCVVRQLRQAAGLDNLLYSPDADFSCFADLALASPEDYYLEGQGSLLQYDFFVLSKIFYRYEVFNAAVRCFNLSS